MAGFRVSNPALSDLESIARYTQEKWGKDQRNKYLLGLEDAFEKLADDPARVKERLDFTPPVRIYRHEKHLIVYVMDENGILIVRVLHQRMNVPAHLTN